MTYYTVPTTFSEWRELALYTRDDCARIFKVSRRTIDNWETGRIKTPFPVLICLQLFSGRLDHLGKQWQGFRITPDCIESPDGDFVRANEIRALRYAMDALHINRQKRCRMNENEKGIIEPLSKENAPVNVTFIDHAPKKKKSKETNQIISNSATINRLF